MFCMLNDEFTPSLQEYQNKQAMEKLGQRLNIKVGSFDPEGSRRMAYPFPMFTYSRSVWCERRTGDWKVCALFECVCVRVCATHTHTLINTT